MSWGDNSSAAGTQYHDRDGNISIFTNALVTFYFDLSFIPKLHFILIYTDHHQRNISQTGTAQYTFAGSCKGK